MNSSIDSIWRLKMEKLMVRVKCKEVGLEKLIRFPIKKDEYGLAFPEELGFIPPKGTKITFSNFDVPEWNGIYKVKKVNGQIDLVPGNKNYEKDEAEVKFLDTYELELKKITSVLIGEGGE